MQKEKKSFTGVFVIDYLIKEGIIKQEESKKLAYMISSHDKDMREVANVILLDRWKLVFPVESLPTKSRHILSKKVTNE